MSSWSRLIERGTHLEVGGVRTHCFDLGAGDPLVLVHGAAPFACAEFNWGAVLEPLSRDYRVVAADQPGFGLTRAPDDSFVDPRRRAEFVIEVLDQLDVEAATLVGNSRGGFQAAYVALERPDLVERLVLVNSGAVSRELSPADHPGGLDVPVPTRANAVERLRRIRDEELLAPEHHPMFEGPITDALIERHREMMERSYDFTRARHEALYRSVDAYNAYHAYAGQHIVHSLDDVAVPTLVAWSETPYVGWPPTSPTVRDRPPRTVTTGSDALDRRERDEGFESGVRAFERLPDAQLHVWKRARHYPMIDRAPSWVATLGAFLDRA